MTVPRDVGLIGLSCVFILTIGGDPLASLPFWTLVLGGYLATRAAQGTVGASQLLGLVMGIVVLWWFVRSTAPGPLGLVSVLGLSYAMFRIIHLIVDARDDELGTPLTLRNYVCYMTFFPAFLAGPIQRYQQFAPQIATPAPALDAETWSKLLHRAVSGVFKWLVLAGLAADLHRYSLDAAASQSPEVMTAAMLATAALAFGLSLYFAFSGYMDLAISAARVLGIALPENFAEPFRTKNFLDFWSRWHITLSEWFKFYVFNPALKLMLERNRRVSRAPLMGAAAYFLAFFLMGLWHGLSLRMLMYGLVLGAGVSLNKLWQVAASKRMGRKNYAALCARPVYQLVAQALALSYFVLALSLLWQPVAEMPVPSTAVAVALWVFVYFVFAGVGMRWIYRPFGRLFANLKWVVTVSQVFATGAWLWHMGWSLPHLLYIWL